MDIAPHMEIVDAKDQHVGTVESVEGTRFEMFEKDALDPKELFLNLSQVAKVDQTRYGSHRRCRPSPREPSFHRLSLRS